MSPTHGKILRVAALLTAFCVAQVYVFAGPVGGAPAVQPQTGGTLKTTDNRPVLVNGNSVRGGTTVLPNSSVETPAGVGATVQLGFAEVDISPGSELVLDFTPGKDVTVTLKRGCVVIKTQGDAQGTIVRPDGTTVATGEGRVANACDRVGAVAPVATAGGPVAGVGVVSGPALALLLISAGAVTFGALAVAARGFNPSPSNP